MALQTSPDHPKPSRNICRQAMLPELLLKQLHGRTLLARPVGRAERERCEVHAHASCREIRAYKSAWRMNVRKRRSLLLDRRGRLLSPRVEAEGAAAWLDRDSVSRARGDVVLPLRFQSASRNRVARAMLSTRCADLPGAHKICGPGATPRKPGVWVYDRRCRQVG